MTAVTAQNTVGIRDFLAVGPELVEAQLDAVLEDLAPRALKTGMLAREAVVKLVSTKGAAGELPPLVVDPVLVGSSGKADLRGRGPGRRLQRAVRLAAVVTPNLPEAGLLTGREITDLESMEEAARELHTLGPGLVVVKGGRRRDAEAVDVAFDGRSVTLLRAPWIDTPNVHGTGCTFSAAIAADLALGLGPLEAALKAKSFVTGPSRAARTLAARGGPRPARPARGRRRGLLSP